MSEKTPTWSREFSLLLEANRVLASTLEIDVLLKVVLELAAKVVEAETGSLLLLDEKTNELVFNVALGEAGNMLKEIRLKVGEGIAGWVAQEQKPAIVNDPANDPRWTRRGDNKTKFVTRSILCVPLLLQGKLLGVVQAINKNAGVGFSENDLAVLEAFAAQTAVAVQNARLFSSLKEEKEKVETVFSQMIQAAVFTDEEGQIQLINPLAEKFLGVTEQNRFRVNIWERLKTIELSPSLDEIRGQASEVVRFEGKKVEGTTLFLSGLLKKIFDDKGNIHGILIFLRDITAEKKEEKLKRDFLSLMSHKLKTPLVAITGYTPLLLEDDSVQKNPFFKKSIGAIHTQGIHLKQLVEKLVSFSLIEAEDLSLSLGLFNAAETLDAVLTSLKTYFEDKKVNVEILDSFKKLPQLYVDPDKFREAIKAVLENAAKFARAEGGWIKIGGRTVSGGVEISVSDNGVGIPAQEFEKIFQKFYQVEESFTGQVEGAGLGLALVKRIIEAHQGQVRLESKVEEGSTFTMFFPSQPT